MTGALSPTHWAIIAVVVLLVFGGKRLPEAARGLGRSMRILKAETSGLRDSEDAQDTRGEAPKEADRLAHDGPLPSAPSVKGASVAPPVSASSAATHTASESAA